MGKFVLLIWC